MAELQGKYLQPSQMEPYHAPLGGLTETTNQGHREVDYRVPKLYDGLIFTHRPTAE